MKALIFILCLAPFSGHAQDTKTGEWAQPAGTPIAGPCPSCKPNEKTEKPQSATTTTIPTEESAAKKGN